MALPKFEDWKAPWELKNEDFDEESARKYIYTLSSDKEKLQERMTTATTERDTARTEVADVKKELEAAQAKGDNADVVTDLQGKLKEAEAAKAKAELSLTQVTVALEKGVPFKQAHRLQGATKEELEADADEFLKDFTPGRKPEGEDDDEGDDDEPNPLSRQPRRLTNPTDNGSGADQPHDILKDIASIPRL